jgi:hypothetical protein
MPQIMKNNRMVQEEWNATTVLAGQKPAPEHNWDAMEHTAIRFIRPKPRRQKENCKNISKIYTYNCWLLKPGHHSAKKSKVCLKAHDIAGLH